eukprot:CAMPEP_0170537538 /NCGR_PEP_ID=MMETSP0209-20121228/102771_1 /TAXON_ID=665100 ORGANISM="Litonotus pictus, Strain P1" /NCGR_SAMPLE_ID=MMETSP0209 /ASSEMBLY_ACC=CAM_ASM_000301 /LENGTH=784 /DNA_ID=CAMNT_0010839053 /DNA_START=33 /DNA_END=2388 /DNA_ORIENTATION=+
METQLRAMDTQINSLQKEQLKQNFSNISYQSIEDPEDLTLDFDLDALVTKEENKQIKTITINLIPLEKVNTAYIKGDFTSWERRKMTKQPGEDGIFEITLKVLKGFRYFYIFEAGNTAVCDFNSEVIANPYREEELNNYLVVKDENSKDANEPSASKTESKKQSSGMVVDSEGNKDSEDKDSIGNKGYKDFGADYKNNKRILEESLSKGVVYSCNSSEKQLLSKIIDFSTNFSTREKQINLQKESTCTTIRGHYDKKLKLVNDQWKTKFEEVFEFFRERVARIDSALFLIKDVDCRNMHFKGIRLYDKNSLKINIDTHLKSRFFESIPFKGIFEKGRFFDHEESSLILEDHKSSTEVLKIYYQTVNVGQDDYKVLKIYYQTVNVGQDDYYDSDPRQYQFGGFGGFGGGSDDEEDHMGPPIRKKMMEQEIVPYKILPEGVDINDYNLVIDKGRIIDVKTKDRGSIVTFEAVLISNKDNRKLSGFISTSMLKIYTTLYSKDIVNILHIHLNDTSSEIRVDSVFLENDEAPEHHKEFKIDSFGKKLNYKFLFKDYKLNRIFYNVSDNFIDEPKFEETRITVGNIVRIKNERNYQNCYAKIINIPLGMLARKDSEKGDVVEKMRSSDVMKDGSCVERHLEELPGFLDLQVLFNSRKEALFNKDKVKISIPVCNVVIMTMKEQVELEKELVHEQIKTENKVQAKLEDDFDRVKACEKYLDFKVLSAEVTDFTQAKELLEFLDGLSLEGYKSLSSSGDEDINQKINFIFGVKDELTANLHKHIRVLSFSK